VTEIFSRQDLYDLVWSKAKTEVAKNMGISDVALGKICKKANIPVPPRGFWAARDAQKRPAQLPLPARGFGQNDTVTIGQERNWYRDDLIGDVPPPPEFTESMEAVVQRARQLVGKVAVPRNLDRPHHLVAKLLAKDVVRRQKAAESGYFWDKPRFEAPAAQRRLRLINSLFLAFSRVGFRPDYGGKEADQLYAHVGDQLVRFAIVPVKRGRQYDSMFGDEAASPRLPLRLVIESTMDPPPGTGKEWQDTDKLSLETVISEAVVSILVFAEAHYRGGALFRHRRLIERKLEQEEAIRKAKELAEQRKREAELKRQQERRRRLFVQTRNWKQSADVRAFVAAVRKHDKAQLHTADVEAWAAWALAEADALDPLSASLSDLLVPPDAQRTDPPAE
jgi:hypothetical protein